MKGRTTFLTSALSPAVLRRVMVAALVALPAAAIIAVATPTSAQDANETAWLAGGCSACHGDVGQGGEPGKMPAGPKLKGTRLSREDVIETVSCGRPGTGMPFHLATAYTESACYGLPLGTPPGDLSKGTTLTAEDIARIADYVKSL